MAGGAWGPRAADSLIGIPTRIARRLGTVAPLVRLITAAETALAETGVMEYGPAHANVPDKGDALRIHGIIVALVHTSYAKNGRWQVVTDVHHRKPEQCEVDTQEQAEHLLAT
jgi:hypothetical protein